MAEQVVGAAAGLPVAVVSDADEVRGWAVRHGATVLDDPGTLDRAAAAGRDWAQRIGLGRVVVAHGDLPLAKTFRSVCPREPEAVAAVRCHRDDGTPVLSVPTAERFAFSYGAGSFRRHRAEAARLDLPFLAVDDPDLAFDVDVPNDLDLLGARSVGVLDRPDPTTARTATS